MREKSREEENAINKSTYVTLEGIDVLNDDQLSTNDFESQLRISKLSAIIDGLVPTNDP